MLTVLGEPIIDLVADAATDRAARADATPDNATRDNAIADDATAHDQATQRRFTALPGGSPLNVAVGLARLGGDTRFMTRRTDDGFGRILAGHATDNGVQYAPAHERSGPSTMAVVSLDAEGRASYDFYIEGMAAWQWSDDELAALPSDTAVFHTGCMATYTEPGAERIAALMHRLRATGEILVTYDPNIRASVIGDAHSGRPVVERCVAAADVVKASDEDLGFLYPDLDAEQAARRWLELGPSLVFLTRGGEDAHAFSHGGADARRVPPPVRMADTIGAGDAFMSGMITSLVDRGLTDRAQLAALDDAVLHEVLGDAELTAALTCERHGAEPPTRAERDAARSRLTD